MKKKEKKQQRKTPLQSKRNVVSMMNLFEKKIDEKILFINIVTGMIQTDKNLYRVDMTKNEVEKVYYESIQTVYNEPFE